MPSWPAGVTTCTVTLGPLLGAGGTAGNLTGWLELDDPDRKIVHEATGTTILSAPEQVPTAAGNQLSFTFPHVDQAGFIDGTGAPITMWGGKLVVTAKYPGGQRVVVRKNFQPLVGQATLDLDNEPDGEFTDPVLGPGGNVTSVAGLGPGVIAGDDLVDALETPLSAAYARGDEAQLDIDSDVARVAAKFAPRGAGISVKRAGTTYSLRRGIGDGRYWRCDLPLISSNPGAYPLHQIKDQVVEVAAKSVVFGDAGVTSSGTWTTSTQAAAYGGQYTQASAAGAYKEYTTPTATATVGFRTSDLSNAGLAKVTIDGDATRATLLPTAQELVDLGVYANTILVANGGTLNPTDRVYEGRQSGSTVWDKTVLFASDLTPGVHVVRVQVTGYFHSGTYLGVSGSTSTAARVYVSGFVYGNTTMKETDAGVDLLAVDDLMSSSSAWEYAHNLKPSGAPTSVFVGNVHGYEVEDTFVIKVDGTTVAPADGTTTQATNTVEIVRTSHLLHPDTGATVVANVITTYTMDRRGLRVDVETDWQVTADVIAAYVMLALNGSNKVGGVPFNRGNLAGWPGGALTLSTVADGYSGHSESAAGWVWDGGSRGVYGVAVWVPRVLDFTRDYATRDFLPNVQTRPTSGPITKIYIPRCYTTAPETVTPSSAWRHSARYAVAYFPDGAGDALTDF